jgi:activator of HSP90 ATPase
MKTVKQTYLINAPIEKVWQALVDPKIIDDWGGGEAKMSEEENFEFSLWGGDIHGKNIEVIKGKKLVQDWMAGEWEEYSKVTFNLSKDGNKTHVDLIHENIPDNEAKEIEDGWKRYYLGPLKELLENSKD